MLKQIQLNKIIS